MGPNLVRNRARCLGDTRSPADARAGLPLSNAYLRTISASARVALGSWDISAA